jgi:putative hydrolase of the HAD superfamily
MTMIKAIIFDLGGVVINYDNTNYYKYLVKVSKIKYSKVKKIIEQKTLPDLESGRITLKQFEKIISKDLHVNKEKVNWLKFYKETVKFNYDIIELINILHKDYTIAFLSNIDKSRYSFTMKILDMNLFDFRFTSCYLRSRKPDLLIYKKVMKKLKLKQKEAIFIDDKIENIKGANKAGLIGIHFKNRRKLDIALYKYKL